MKEEIFMDLQIENFSQMRNLLPYVKVWTMSKFLLYSFAKKAVFYITLLNLKIATTFKSTQGNHLYRLYIVYSLHCEFLNAISLFRLDCMT